MGNNGFTPKVLHVLDHSLPIYDGYAFRSQNILKCQRALGWKPCVVTSIKHQLGLLDITMPPVEDLDGIRFYRSKLDSMKAGNFTHFQVITQLYATLKQAIAIEKPDILHVHSPALNVLPSLRLGRKFGIPVVYEIRAFWEDAAVDQGKYAESSWKYWLVHRLESWVCGKVNHLAVLCEGIKKDLRNRGIEESQISIVSNGIHVAEFLPRPGNKDFRNTWGLDGKIVIGFIGSFYRYEGLDVLVEAFDKLLKKNPHLMLLLVGGGEVENELKEQVHRLSLDAHVIFPGRIPHSQIPGVYGLFNFLVYPRNSVRLTELVTPLKPLEAMAMEKPLVASNIGGHRELIRDGETGVLFQAGNVESLVQAIEGLLCNPDRVQHLVQTGKAWVTKERSWENIVKGYIPIYEKVLGAVSAKSRNF